MTIEVVHGEGDLIMANGIEARLVREELSNLGVEFLLRDAFLARIGMSEEEVRIELYGDTLVRRKRLTVVGRKRVGAGYKRCGKRDGVRHPVCYFKLDVGDQRVTGQVFVDSD